MRPSGPTSFLQQLIDEQPASTPPRTGEPLSELLEASELRRERQQLRKRLLSPAENHLDIRLRLADIRQRLAKLERGDGPAHVG